MVIPTELQLRQSKEPLPPGSTVTVAFIAPGSSGTFWKVTASNPVFPPKGLMATSRFSGVGEGHPLKPVFSAEGFDAPQRVVGGRAGAGDLHPLALVRLPVGHELRH